MKNSTLAERFVRVVFPEGTCKLVREFRVPRAAGRTAVFAMFSSTGLIPDTAIQYLRGLADVVDNIIVVADCPIFHNEVNCLQDLIVCGIFVRHEEYDFGSYRRGVEYIRNHPVLSTTKELVLCNDSCYGPVRPFADSFKRMADIPWDFWGMCENAFYEWHLQSYWLVLSEKVWKSATFLDFMAGVQKEKSVKDVILKYELGLTSRLCANGFVGMACYALPTIEYPWLDVAVQNPTTRPIWLIEQGCPLVKVKALRDENCNFDGIGQTLALIKARNAELYASICRQERNGK